MKMASLSSSSSVAVSASIVFLLLLLLVLNPDATTLVVDATSVKMDYLPVGFARVDPILSATCPSDHVHTFYGPQSGMDPRRRRTKKENTTSSRLSMWEALMDTPTNTNTGNVEENKSMYWHPTVYQYSRTTKTYTRSTMAQSSAYYIWTTGETTAFPEGFRMIGGYDIAQSQAVAECVNPQPCEDDKEECYTENTFFPVTHCDELEVSMRLPNCWNGIDLGTTPPHTQHVAYAEESDFAGACPPTHPIPVPQIQLFFRIVDYPGGWHTFSDLSSIFHVDYVSGWDVDFLQNVLDNCANEGDAAMPNFFCEEYLTFRDGPKCTNAATCDFADPNLLQKLQAIQPTTPIDVRGTIIDEETNIIVNSPLPRGSCNGILIGGDDDDGDGNNDNVDNTNNPITTSPTPVAPSPLPPPQPSSSQSIDDNNDEDDEEGVESLPSIDDSNDGDDGDDDDEEESTSIDSNEGDDDDEEASSIDNNTGSNSNDSNSGDNNIEIEDKEEEDDEGETECTNKPDKTKRFKYKGKLKNCKWVGNNVDIRCAIESLRKKCRTTCNFNDCTSTTTNCQNTPDKNGTFKYKGQTRNWCKWVQKKNTERRCKKIALKKKCQTSCDYQGCV